MPRAHADPWTGQLMGGKAMQVVNTEMIGQGLSAAEIQTNTGTGEKSAEWDDTSLGQCAQLKK